MIKPPYEFAVRRRLIATIVAVALTVMLAPGAPANGQRNGDAGWVSTRVGAIGDDSASLSKDRWLGQVTALASDSQGRLVIAHQEYGFGFVSRKNTDGTITRLAGVGDSTASVAPGTALLTKLGSAPQYVLSLNDGSLLLFWSNSSLRLRTDGYLEGWASDVVRSNCSWLQSDSVVCNISGVAKDGSGNVVIADFGSHSVVRVAPSGLISTRIAGNGAQSSRAFSTGASALGTSLYFPGDPIVWNGLVLFRDWNWKTWQIESSGTLTEIASLSSQTSSGGTYVRKFLGVSNGRVVFSDGTSLYSQSFLGDRTRIFGGGFATPGDGVNGLTALMDQDPVVTMQSSGLVAFLPRGDSVVFELTEGGILRHVAGRIEANSIDGRQVRGNISYVERADDGSVVFGHPWIGKQIYKFLPSAGSVTALTGSQFTWPFLTIAAHTISDGQGVPGCFGELFTNSTASGVKRISPDGVVTRVKAPTFFPYLMVNTIGGGCGFVAAVNSGRLLRLHSDASWTDLGLVPGGVYVSRIRPNGKGGLLLANSQSILEYSAAGSWSTVSAQPAFDVAALGGGWFLVLRYRNPSLGDFRSDLIELSPSGNERVLVSGVNSSDGSVLVDGPADAVPLSITSITYDPGGFIWVVDQSRFIRSIRYSPPTGAPQAAGPSTTSVRRSATVGSATVNTVGRVAAPTAGG